MGLPLERGYNPPLGLLYIASSLLKYTNVKVEVLDTQVEELSYSEIEQTIKQSVRCMYHKS